MFSNLKPVVFLDRDGVINKDKGYVYRIEDFEWVEGAKKAIIFAKEQGYNVIVITNQSGVGRGYYTEDDIRALHQYMNNELSAWGSEIDDFYYCPHHPEAKIQKYCLNCTCRKPEPGLIRKAIEDWNVDMKNSFFIGDKDSDMEAGKKAGIASYKFTESNLYTFVRSLVLHKY